MGISPVAIAIIACEVGFWAVLAVGLAVRYGLRRVRVSSAILRCIPLVDLILVTVVAVDIAAGAQVGQTHRIAGLYLGVTIAFGHAVVRWADVRVAHRFDREPAPTPTPRGASTVRKEAVDFGRWLIAAGVALALTAALSVTVASPAQAAQLWEVAPVIGIITVIWLVTGPVWALVTATGSR